MFYIFNIYKKIIFRSFELTKLQSLAVNFYRLIKPIKIMCNIKLLSLQLSASSIWLLICSQLLSSTPVKYGSMHYVSKNRNINTLYKHRKYLHIL
jgi:hypothetical protein